jgi:hypothetical protein
MNMTYGAVLMLLVSSSTMVAAKGLLAWRMAPPLVPLPLLIAVLVVSCMVLFLVRSSRGMKQQMYDRIYGPGVRKPKSEWWDEDLDPIFERKVQGWTARFRKG